MVWDRTLRRLRQGILIGGSRSHRDVRALSGC